MSHYGETVLLVSAMTKHALRRHSLISSPWAEALVNKQQHYGMRDVTSRDTQAKRFNVALTT